MDKKWITVAYARPDRQWEIKLQVSAFANVALCIRRSGILASCHELKLEDLQVGIYSRKVGLDAVVKEGDRIEIYRPLLINPMEARRLRAQKKSQGL